MKNKFKIKRVLFPIGIIFILIGVLLIFFAFYHEVLDDKYIIKDVTEYPAKINKRLESGEMIASKDTKYLKQGIYQITYTNYAKKINKKALIEQGTSFNITDMFGNGYELIKNDIIINEKKYKMNDNTLSSKEKININYQNNVLDIEIPDNLVLNNNNIVIKLKLTGREENIKYITSQDAYYSFIPSIENNYYAKKISQAYVIEGYGYIQLKGK